MLISIHNALWMFACDVGNAYLEYKTREKVYAITLESFGAHSGNIFLFCNTLYILNTGGTLFRDSLAETLGTLGHRPSNSDPHLWKCSYFCYFELYPDVKHPKKTTM